jgi:hypothetical protein
MAVDVRVPAFDERANLQGRSGLHVLIAGVSGYPNLPAPGDNSPGPPAAFGMRQLSSTTLTAYKIYQWILAHKDSFPVPLATCRVLLAPGAGELAAEPSLQDFPRATVNNFLQAAKDWRADAATSPDNMTLFYFAGHGIERSKGDAVLLLEEFGDGLGGALRNCVDMYNIYTAMANAEGGGPIAQRQVYFVDACRNLPRAVPNFERESLGTTPAFNVTLAGEDKRSAPIFYAAAPGTTALALPGQQTVFSMALLQCLEGDAGVFEDVDGQDRWHVSVYSLSEALAVKIEDLNQALGGQQYYTPDGQQINKPICFLDQAPTAEVVFEVDPFDALSLARIEVLDNAGNPLVAIPWPLDPYPYRTRWTAGFCKIRATIQPPDPRYKDVQQDWMLRPPRRPRKLRVT